MEKLNLGEKIMLRRKRKGLTQKEFSRIAGVSRATIIGIENNQVEPINATLSVIASALDVTIEDLKND